MAPRDAGKLVFSFAAEGDTNGLSAVIPREQSIRLTDVRFAAHGAAVEAQGHATECAVSFVARKLTDVWCTLNFFESHLAVLELARDITCAFVRRKTWGQCSSVP